MAAQLCSEFRSFFPENAVHYFISYYDYYQPEAYIPQTDTYIEKDSSINDEIDRLRHAATSALFERRDVIIVASVSCIYGLGSPEDYVGMTLSLKHGDFSDRDNILRRLVGIQYERNDIGFTRGTFRVRGDVIEIVPVYEENVIRIEFFGDEVDRILELDPVTGEIIDEKESITIYPATHFITSEEKMKRAIASIEEELRGAARLLQAQGKLLEAQRLRAADGVRPGDAAGGGGVPGDRKLLPPPDGPGARGAAGDAARLLPARLLDDHRRVAPDDPADRRRCTAATARAKRPWWSTASASLRPWTTGRSRLKSLRRASTRWSLSRRRRGRTSKRVTEQVVEQIIRPTGLGRPRGGRPAHRGADRRLARGDPGGDGPGRAGAGDDADQEDGGGSHRLPADVGVRVRYLHSEIESLERIEILRDLRLGEFDVLVGINLLREGLTCPKCRWWRSWTPTRRASSVRRRR